MRIVTVPLFRLLLTNPSVRRQRYAKTQFTVGQEQFKSALARARRHGSITARDILELHVEALNLLESENPYYEYGKVTDAQVLGLRDQYLAAFEEAASAVGDPPTENGDNGEPLASEDDGFII